MTKSIYIIKQFQIDDGKRFANFQCRKISLNKVFTVLKYKYSITNTEMP